MEELAIGTQVSPKRKIKSLITNAEEISALVLEKKGIYDNKRKVTFAAAFINNMYFKQVMNDIKNKHLYILEEI